MRTAITWTSFISIRRPAMLLDLGILAPSHEAYVRTRRDAATRFGGKDVGMGVEVRPLGVNCNIACQYCYQNPQRDAGNLAERYDLAEIKKAIEREGGPFVLFGGEPLLVPE